MMDCTIDALMVVQARIDPDNGAQQLQRFSWLIYPIGGIIGSFAAAPMTEYFHPQWSFLIMGFIVFVIFLVALKLEENTDHLERDEEGNLKVLEKEPFCVIIK